MADPYIGEIRAVAFNFAPPQWAMCNGQLLPIQSNSALFSILGTTYGGNGTTTFGLPNLQGRFPVGAGRSQPPGLTPVTLGQQDGVAEVTLSYQQMPSHTHRLRAVAAPGNSSSPVDAVWAQGRVGRAPDRMYDAGPATGSMSSPTDGAGSGLPHNNRSPYLTLNFIIALTGEFPPRP